MYGDFKRKKGEKMSGLILVIKMIALGISIPCFYQIIAMFLILSNENKVSSEEMRNSSINAAMVLAFTLPIIIYL